MTSLVRLSVLLLAMVFALGACGDGDDETADDLGQRAGEAAEDLGQAAGEAAEDLGQALEDSWESLRTDGERLIDEIETRDDPQAKEDLLEHCRDVLEQLRATDAPNAEEVDDLCNRIRDTDAGDEDAWAEIRQDIDELAPA